MKMKEMKDGARLLRKLPWCAPAGHEELLTRDWLVTNGLGGHATGPVAGR